MSENLKSSEKSKQEIEFHYLRTNNYRSYHVDGVYGGVTPKGNIYMELFLERGPTPRNVIHELKDDGSLGKELTKQSKSGLIREVEAGIVVDLRTAEALRNWLSEKIELLTSYKRTEEDK